MTPTVVLIHGGKSTGKKLAAALPGARVRVIYRKGLSSAYDERAGLAQDHPNLASLVAAEVPEHQPGEPLIVLAFSAGGWALRHYLRHPDAQAAVDAAIFLDATYGASGGACNLAPWQGVVEFGKRANAHPDAHRLIMTWSAAHPAPGICAQAIQKAAGGGPGVFLRGYSAAGIEGHRAQQTAVGPAVVAELVTPWLAPSSPPSGGAELAIITAVALAYLWS